MSTTRDHNDIVFQCDGCRDTLDTNTSNFEAARNLLRRAGWKPFKATPDAADWSHRCAACQRQRSDDVRAGPSLRPAARTAAPPSGVGREGPARAPKAGAR